MNRLYGAMHLCQLIASTSIICLTAFEAVLALSDPSVCLKFLVYMTAALFQLLFWCWLGNEIFHQVLADTRLRHSLTRCISLRDSR